MFLKTPLQVRLNREIGLLPPGIRIELPFEAAVSLIHRRKAVPVGNLSLTPELLITEAELEIVGMAEWQAHR